MELVDILIEEKKFNEKFFRDPVKYARKIKTLATEIFGKDRVEVYIFGSVLSGEFTPLSDIDVCVIAPEIAPEKRGEILASLKKVVGLTSPFEIHLVTKKVFENWYKHFIKEFKKI